MSSFLFLLELDLIVYKEFAAEDEEQDDPRDDLGSVLI